MQSICAIFYYLFPTGSQTEFLFHVRQIPQSATLLNIAINVTFR